MSTSGSTGQPAIFLRGLREEADFSARWERVYRAFGCSPFEAQVNIASGLNRDRNGAIHLLRRMGLLPLVIGLASTAPTAELLASCSAPPWRSRSAASSWPQAPSAAP